jgi:hypothetical protein
MIELKETIKSNFVGHLGIKNYSKFEKEFIFPVVQVFFDAKKIKYFKSINESAGFSDLDFQRKNFADFFAHFYDFIVEDIRKDSDNIDVPVKYCITLDLNNCSKFCDITKIHYDELCLNEKPVMYFIYVDIKDVFSYLRTEAICNDIIL